MERNRLDQLIAERNYLLDSLNANKNKQESIYRYNQYAPIEKQLPVTEAELYGVNSWGADDAIQSKIDEYNNNIEAEKINNYLLSNIIPNIREQANNTIPENASPLTDNDVLRSRDNWYSFVQDNASIARNRAKQFGLSDSQIQEILGIAPTENTTLAEQTSTVPNSVLDTLLGNNKVLSDEDRNRLNLFVPNRNLVQDNKYSRLDFPSTDLTNYTIGKTPENNNSLVLNVPINSSSDNTSTTKGSKSSKAGNESNKANSTKVYGSPLQIGAGQVVIPSTGYSTQDNTGGATISVNPVDIRGDNGGSTWAAMNALYTDPSKPPSLGELLAFSSIMNGKRTLGGLGDIQKTMELADRNNAYAAQSNVANRVQDLMKQGKSMEEARYQALSEYLLDNGMNRSAVSLTMPEYAKEADARAKRELDIAAATGGTYNGNGALGYTPLGIRSISSNGDTYSVDLNGNKIDNIPLEYLAGTVLGATKGDGSGTKHSNELYTKFLETLLKKEEAKTTAESDKLDKIIERELKRSQINRNNSIANRQLGQTGVTTTGNIIDYTFD